MIVFYEKNKFFNTDFIVSGVADIDYGTGQFGDDVLRCLRLRLADGEAVEIQGKIAHDMLAYLRSLES